MNLLFPQWQGAGNLPALRQGAEQLALERPDANWHSLDLAVGTFAEVEHGIQAYRQLKTQLETITEFLKAERPDTLFTLGGDCSIELAPISHLNNQHNNLTVVWFDAHADLQVPETSPSGDLHGMPLRLLLGDGDRALKQFLPTFLRSEQVLLAGVRMLDSSEESFVSRQQFRRLSAAQLNEDPKLTVQALRSAGAQQVYLHVDFDVLDPEVFSSLGWPVSGGMTVAALEQTLAILHQEFTVVGGGLTEYLPKRSEDKQTARHVLDAWLP